MGFGFKQPLVGKKRCVTTLITAAKETNTYIVLSDREDSYSRLAWHPGPPAGLPPPQAAQDTISMEQNSNQTTSKSNSQFIILLYLS